MAAQHSMHPTPSKCTFKNRYMFQSIASQLVGLAQIGRG